MMRRVMWLLAAAAAAVSCGRLDCGLAAGDCDAEKVAVSFVPVAGAATQSSIAADEDLLRDFNLVIFRGGMLEYSGYVECDGTTDGVSVELVKGGVYDMFAVGNVGEMEIPLKEEDFLGGCCLEYHDTDDFDGVFPMAWSERGKTVGADMSVSVGLVRLVSKISFSIDCDSILGGLNVSSVRLRQAAGAVWPFGNGAGADGLNSRISRPEDAVDGDYASEEDLEIINSGGSLVFYCLENCQGTLLPGNTDEWAKVPASLYGDESRLCTFLEVKAGFTEDFALSGGAEYRLYLGEDNTTDFDILRNTETEVSLFATRDGLDRVSWRVSSEGGFREGLAEGCLLAGLHPLSGLYVGEIFRYGVSLSPSLVDYLGDELYESYICSRSGAISFENIEISGLQLSCDGKCLATVQGEELILVTPRGGISLGSEAGVLAPRMVLSPDAVTTPSQPVRQYQPPTLTVNGESDTFFLYLTDNEGYCLNSSECYGFDATLFSYDTRTIADSGIICVTEAVASKLNSTLSLCRNAMNGTGPRDTPLASYTVLAVNDGNDITVNRNLGYAVFAHNPFRMDILERNYGLSTSTPVDYDIFPVTVTAYGPWTAENQSGSSELAVGISNRSAIYLDIIFWSQAQKRTASTHTMQSWASDGRSEIASAGASTKEIMYATSSYFPGLDDYMRKHYGAYYAFQYNKAVVSGTNGEEHYFHIPSKYSSSLLEQYIYSDPAGFLTELSSTVTTYTGTSWWHSFKNHFSFDIKTDGMNLAVAGRLRFEDRFLEGGGAEASASYPYFGGINVYSDGIPCTYSDTFVRTYTDCTPRNLYQMASSEPLELTLGYDTSARKYYISCTNNTSGSSVEVKYKVDMSGTVTCHPNGQWYKAVVHDVAGNTDWNVTGPFVPGPSRTYIDGGDARTLMNKIFAMSYPDNSSNIGTSGKDFQHFCHPTSGILTFEIRS
ncbi:MAG: DUF4906 domain-containing protein, partial [Bacteroidales bacterium]|nr:DUF4906 domain-containing protein [Bacteroidales bacterium]